MLFYDAKNIISKYACRSYLAPEEEFLLIEAYEYLIRTTGETRWMTELGGYYYEQKEFDLARKYYEMADQAGDDWAPEGLGYIWYYGRTGEKDYKKAYRYYSRASENGYVRSTMKLADMYKNGYYVDKDVTKYNAMIEHAYRQTENAMHPYEPRPEICARLAKVRMSQGAWYESAALYQEAKLYLADRLAESPFFGDLHTMKGIVEELTLLGVQDPSALDLYDLYTVLQRPGTVRFRYGGKAYQVEAAEEEDGSVAVRFRGKWYRSVDDFFEQALLDGERLPALYWGLSGFEVM